jgi:hypothetical protein
MEIFARLSNNNTPTMMPTTTHLHNGCVISSEEINANLELDCGKENDNGIDDRAEQK